MKIDLSTIDLENFKVREDILSGRKVFLINPSELKCEWTKDNLLFRSLLIDEGGNILSRGFDKFFNAGEKPHLYPNIENFNDLVYEEKCDGSLAICDFIFNNFNCRTRGTISYKFLENFADFDLVLNKYPKIIDICRANLDDTYLFEITTPRQRIVLSYGNEPDIFFLGFIHKDTGLYYPPYSKEGEFLKKEIGCKSPKIYSLQGSIPQIIEEIKKWEQKEGCVIKYNNSQNFIKAKSIWYLNRHVLRGKLVSLNNLLDLFFELDCPDFLNFYKNIEETVDFETAEEIKDKLIEISDQYLFTLRDIYDLKCFVEENSNLDRKSFAIKTLTEKKEYSSFIFEILDKKELSKKSLRKLMEKELKIL